MFLIYDISYDFYYFTILLFCITNSLKIQNWCSTFNCVIIIQPLIRKMKWIKISLIKMNIMNVI